MKILPADKIREADAYTIKNEPISHIDLMERAAGKCTDYITDCFGGQDITFQIFCGPGNNGGDGLVIARLLYYFGFDVKTHIIWYSKNASEAFQTNLQRLEKLENAEITHHREDVIETEIASGDIIIDAIFGNGLSRPAEGIAARTIEKINQSGAKVIAIDVPSGLYIDSSAATGNPIVKADITLTFAPPKLAFFLPENDAYIGLMPEFIENTESDYALFTIEEAGKMLRKRRKYQHKGDFGHSLIIAGSKGKTGAAVLAAKGALRSGTGLLSLQLPSDSVSIVQTAVPEAMAFVDERHDFISQFPDLAGFSSIAIGPGIGDEPETESALKILIQESPIPIIFDADAINILAENPTWLKFLKPECIFTPHPGEFRRLVGNWDNDFERLERQKEFCTSHRCWMVLKGAHSSICSPQGKTWFNSTGNPGMATGGSGDVLTGIIAALKAQQYTSGESCLLGTLLHGLAGDIALENQSEESLASGDIPVYLGKAFKKLKKIKDNQ